MFSRLFKKEPERSEWVGWFCLVENKPASVSVDCLAHNDITEKLQSLLILKIKNLDTSRNGFPSREIFDELYALENKIEEIARNHKSKYSGRFITDGTGYYLVYSNHVEVVKSKLEELMSKVGNFSFDISIRKSKEWQDYYKMLYPPKKEKQRYHNALIINRIIQAGDNPEKDRGIDHAILFNTSEEREKYLKELEKIKFPFEKFELFDDEKIDHPFMLELKVRTPLKIDILNSSTDMLITLTEKYNALYDGWGAEVVR